MILKIFARIGHDENNLSPNFPTDWVRIHRHTIDSEGRVTKTEILSGDGWRQYDPLTYTFTLNDEVFAVEPWP